MTLTTPAPHWVDEEEHSNDIATMAVWAWGPQGHPASMRMTLYIDDKTVELWQSGPLVFKIMDVYKHNLGKELERGNTLGQQIAERFGDNPFWWRCQVSCQGYSACLDCAHKRTEAERASLEFLRQIGVG